VKPRVLLIFLDGVGIGPADPDVNPFLSASASGRIPTLLGMTGGRVPTLDRPRADGPHGSAFPLDASLDVDGVPQSGTGQAALLTGESAAEINGRHFGPWTPVRLRPLVEERSVLRRAAEVGKTVAFANAYPRGWPGPRGGRRIAGPPLAARGANVLDRHEDALGRGEAVASAIVNDGWRGHLGYDWLPVVSPEEAGANLARISARADLTLYAHYATDTAGHRRSMAKAIQALARVDRFLGGVLDALGDDTLVLIASDHGNLEDVRGGHTKNPALGLATGAEAGGAPETGDLRMVTPFLLSVLGVGG
jgi:2,3-bisphosphoglycerate-independent phosphoglycerate mutase